MFTDVEMAILSQLSYCDYPKPPETLSEFLEDNRAYLEKELGPSYFNALDTLQKKTENYPYTIVATEDDPETGFAAFAIEGPGHEVLTTCRGTEFSELLSEESKRIMKILKQHGINSINTFTVTAATSILADYNLTGDGLTDVLADIELAFAKESDQQRKMEQFVERLELEGYNGYYFTGHSLGGNITLHGAMTLNDPELLKGVVTYNAPGYNEEYLRKHQEDYFRIRDKITNYQNERDAISEALISPGNVVILDCKDPDATGIEAHFFNQLLIDESGESYQISSVQRKEATLWGGVFGAAGGIGNQLNNTENSITERISVWAGTAIKVPLSTLQDHARTMRELSDTNADVFDRIYNSLLCLKGGGQWQGTSLEAVVEATEKNKEKFADTVAEMRSLAAFLEKFTTELAEKDTEIKNKINAI